MHNDGNNYSRFTSIVRQYEPLIKRIAAHFYVPESYAFRALQSDLVTHLWLLVRDTAPDTALHNQQAWLYTALYHKAFNIVRDENRRQKHLVYGLDLTHLPDDPQPDPHVARLHHLINQLPDSDRTIILMHIDGLSINEIAAFLGKTKSQTYSLLHSIRNKLRRLNRLADSDNP